MNPNDERRDQILRFLYERHKTTRGIQKIPIGIRDLQREMKTHFGMTQPGVASNLDYLVQVGWGKSCRAPGGRWSAPRLSAAPLKRRLVWES